MSRSLADLRTRLLPIALTQLVGFLCGVAGVRINSELIEPGDYGRYGVFLTFTPLGMWVIHAGLVRLVQRNWAEADRPALWRGVFRAATRRLPWLAAAALAGGFFVSPAQGWMVAPFIFAAAAALSYGTLAAAALQAERRHWDDFWASAGGSLSRTFLPPLLYFATGGAIGALYGGFGLHALAFAGLAVLLARPRVRVTPAAASPALLPASFAGPMFSLLAVAGWMLTGVNRWLVALFFGPEAAGYFTLASNIAVIIPTMLGTIVMQYFLPEFFAAPQGEPDQRKQLAARIDRIAASYWSLALLGLLALRVALPALTGPLIDPTYRPAIDWVLPVGCFFTALTTTYFYQQLLVAGRRELACGPVEAVVAVILLLGGAATAAAGPDSFRAWLLLTPLAPWLVYRPLARRAYFVPGA